MQLLEAGLQAALEPAKQQLFEAYRGKAGFTGCGIGFRRKAGRVTGEPAVIAMVTKKLPAGAVSRSRLLPAGVTVGGRDWCVDVVEVGPLTLASSTLAVCLATDQYGFNAFLTPIGNNLSPLGVELVPATSGSPCTVTAQVGMHIEKVGRTSGYTSSTVDAVAAQVQVYGPSNNVLTSLT